jgi:hypothetical protein
MGDERKENEGGRPSVGFVPLFWVGRVANRWCLTDGDTRVYGDTEGMIIGSLSDWMRAITALLEAAEQRAEERKAGKENMPAGAQAALTMTAAKDALADMKSEDEEYREDHPVVIDHFLEHPRGQAAVRKLKEMVDLFKDGLVDHFAKDMSPDFYQGMLNGFILSLAAKAHVESKLGPGGPGQTRTLEMLDMYIVPVALGAATLAPQVATAETSYGETLKRLREIAGAPEASMAEALAAITRMKEELDAARGVVMDGLRDGDL